MQRKKRTQKHIFFKKVHRSKEREMKNSFCVKNSGFKAERIEEEKKKIFFRSKKVSTDEKVLVVFFAFFLVSSSSLIGLTRSHAS